MLGDRILERSPKFSNLLYRSVDTLRHAPQASVTYLVFTTHCAIFSTILSLETDFTKVLKRSAATRAMRITYPKLLIGMMLLSRSPQEVLTQIR